MTTPQPSAQSGVKPSSESGEHAAADRGTFRIGGSTFTWRWSGVAKAALIVMSGLPALILALRAPSTGEVQAKVDEVEKTVETTAKTKAEEVRRATATPIDNHADELAILRAEVATLAGAIKLFKELPHAPPAPVAGQSKGRRRRELAKQVKAAVTDLKAIQVRAATEPAPLTAPKAPPPEALKDGAAQQKPRDAGGANP